MVNGMLHDMELEKRIKAMPERELLEFMARQMAEVCQKVEGHEKRLKKVEQDNKRLSGIIGGISGLITAVAVGIINWFVGRN